MFTIVLLGFFFAPFVIGVLGNLSETEGLEVVKAWFFEIELAVLILIGLIAFYFSCWAIKGILRKFTREDEPLFTRKGAFLFLLGFELILLGLVYHYLGNRDIEVSYLYWTISWIAVFAVPLGALRSLTSTLNTSDGFGKNPAQSQL